MLPTSSSLFVKYIKAQNEIRTFLTDVNVHPRFHLLPDVGENRCTESANNAVEHLLVF